MYKLYRNLKNTILFKENSIGKIDNRSLYKKGLQSSLLLAL